METTVEIIHLFDLTVCSLFALFPCHTPEHQYLPERSFYTSLVPQFLCLVPNFLQLPRRRHPWSPGSRVQGGLSSWVPLRLSQLEGQYLADYCSQGTANTAGWNTPQSFWEGGLFACPEASAWGAGFWRAALTGAKKMLPRNGGWWRQSSCLASALPQLTSISQKGVYTLLRHLDFCGYCQGTPLHLLALMTSMAYAYRSLKTVTSSKRILK